MFEGSPSHILVDKFKSLRNKLRWWNKNIFGWVDRRIEEGVQVLNEIEDGMDIIIGNMSEKLIRVRSEAQGKIWSNMKLKESMLKQKARTKWVKEGDLNSRYFHSILIMRCRRNNMSFIKVGDVMFEDVELTKGSIREFFESKFKKVESSGLRLDMSDLTKLSNEENELLVAPFSTEEIVGALSISAGNKSPEPDEFDLEFLKHYWAVVRSDLMNVFNHFHQFGNLLKALVSPFIALIPKNDNP
ncbi:unnamed protein product [Lathyrus sativus]|nr:unnamed protein product [Lathyrus sativus]